MSKRQTRHSMSVNAHTYARVHAFCDHCGLSISKFVESLIHKAIDEADVGFVEEVREKQMVAEVKQALISEKECAQIITDAKETRRALASPVAPPVPAKPTPARVPPPVLERPLKTPGRPPGAVKAGIKYNALLKPSKNPVVIQAGHDVAPEEARPVKKVKANHDINSDTERGCGGPKLL